MFLLKILADFVSANLAYIVPAVISFCTMVVFLSSESGREISRGPNATIKIIFVMLSGSFLGVLFLAGVWLLDIAVPPTNFTWLDIGESILAGALAGSLGCLAHVDIIGSD